MKPVIEIQFFDYIWPAYMQLRDELALMRWRSNNANSAPVVIRVTYGGYLKGGAIYHSHTRSAPYPSQTDVNLAFPPHALYVIVGLASGGVEPGRRVQHPRAHLGGQPRQDRVMVLAGVGDADQAARRRREQQRPDGRVDGAIGDVEQAGPRGTFGQAGVQPRQRGVVGRWPGGEQVARIRAHHELSSCW